MSCRYFGISRQTYYRWHRRYKPEGIEACAPARGHRSTAPMPPTSRPSGRSSTCDRTTTSGPRRSRCTSSATTMSRSASRGCGGSSTASPWAGCRPLSGTSATTAEGSGTRSNCPAPASRST
ncbi:helix-turn-helix domain-containing protein [Streptomyces sp. NBC_01283]|nr:helix-turn-helix domain-containing protein [Streptomyces sp. NBC_01283]